jgi:hypothetical protein
VIVFLAWIPFFKYNKPPNGHWFISDKGILSSKYTALFAIVTTLAGILFNAYVLNFEIVMQGVPALISNGIIPLLILLLLMGSFYQFYLKGLRLSKSELIQAIFVFILVAFILLSVTGIFFRGKDMELAFPWNV